MTSTSAEEFIHDLRLSDVPAVVVDQARRCLLDLLGVAAAGSRTELSAIVYEEASTSSPQRGLPAHLWFDGRASSPAGAAWANAATIDAYDGHDGHRLTKGHAGVAVLPALLATLEPLRRATLADVLSGLVVGYEIATRAGVALHATAGDYHSSGAWNAVAAAAAAARALGLSTDATAEAMGIAEYHGPRAPMMRCIEHPAMVKDSSGWGAHVGVSAAALAARGFTGGPAELLTVRRTDAPHLGEDAPTWDDLGDRWTILEQYFKPYPICRWAHPAVEAVLGVVTRQNLSPAAIQQIEVDTFAAATQLATTCPVTTEQAQYSLPFPVAVAAVHHELVAELINHPTHADPTVRGIAESMVLREHPDMTAAFPGVRSAAVTITLHTGQRLVSGPITAAGDPEQPMSTEQLTTKFLGNTVETLGHDRSDLLRAAVDDTPETPLGHLIELTVAGRH